MTALANGEKDPDTTLPDRARKVQALLPKKR